MVTITDPHGTIIYANDLFCKVSGFSRSDVIGHTHNIIRHHELPDETVSSIWRMIREGNSWQGIIKSKRKCGSNFWTKTTVAPVMGYDNVPAKYIWVRHDITDLKQTEYELYAAKQRADQQLLENVKNAFRIQSAILPDEQDLSKYFPGSFLLFSPQQSVSGDFYWFTHHADQTLVVLGDGTGHGVSASFVSLIALTSLKGLVLDSGESDPGKLLTQLNWFLYRTMNKHKGSGLSESVDMAVCNYNHTTRELQYASGKSRIYLVRRSEVYSLDRDESSIGSLAAEEYNVVTRSITLEKGDRIFMMSDGLADQFGGERNKRLGSRHVKELLSGTGHLPMKEQKEIIRKYFLLWKGENEQTDDLSLLAFRAD